MHIADAPVRPRIVVTRKGAGLGAVWLPISAARIRPLARARLLRLLRRQRYEWIAVTSGRSVTAVATAFRGLGASARGLRLPKIAAVGPSTAEQLRLHGVRVALEGPGPGGGALAEAIVKAGALTSTRVIWPRASAAEPHLARVARAHGITVTDIALYDMVAINNRGVLALDRGLRTHQITAICFSAPSAVAHLFTRLSSDAHASLRRLPAGSFGPTTTAALRAVGVSDITEVSRGAATARVQQFIETLAGHRRRIA